MKQIFTVLLVSTTMLVKAQFGVSFGIKGNAMIRASHPSWTANNTELESKKSMGFNGGIFSKIKVPFIPIFLMPEVYFTQYKSQTTYTVTVDKLGSKDVILSANNFRIDIPILIGYEFMGIGGVFVGPVFYNQLRGLNKNVAKLHDIGKSEITSGNVINAAEELAAGFDEEYMSGKKTSVGYQFGISIDIIPKLTINARYEIASKADERKYKGKFGDEVSYSDKPKFFIVGAGFKF